ncbi:hypothetical protein HGM15179_002443 [Zosterops borbonicus]|uniref:Uncharacterized protein n=1 Tax=Zosterops borbonicus TaxID=364589 RepID=A0A8K1GT06_9PASS|nr:hypothetical protein HGM15179_002443 [Zosterops borbonicus]
MWRNVLALRQISQRTISTASRRQYVNRVPENQKLFQWVSGLYHLFICVSIFGCRAGEEGYKLRLLMEESLSPSQSSSQSDASASHRCPEPGKGSQSLVNYDLQKKQVSFSKLAHVEFIMLQQVIPRLCFYCLREEKAVMNITICQFEYEGTEIEKPEEVGSRDGGDLGVHFP